MNLRKYLLLTALSCTGVVSCMSNNNVKDCKLEDVEEVLRCPMMQVHWQNIKSLEHLQYHACAKVAEHFSFKPETPTNVYIRGHMGDPVHCKHNPYGTCTVKLNSEDIIIEVDLLLQNAELGVYHEWLHVYLIKAGHPDHLHHTWIEKYGHDK